MWGNIAIAFILAFVVTLGGDYLTINEAICIIRNWLGTEFKGGRYEERLKMVEEIEENNMK